MKQRLLLISWAMLFVVFSAFAKQRTVEQAKALAGTFLASPSLRATTGGQQQDGLTLVYTATGEASGASDALYYVFDRGASHGFVIVSSDDRARDVLGYSDAGSFNAGSLPDNFKYWLSVYEKELQWLSKLPESYLRKSGQDQPATKAPAFEASVAPLVKSLWDQGDPYNLMTPINPTNGVRTVTGCVATAMAQIMYYHKWPATGNGIHQYTSVTHNLTSSVDFGATTYYWGNMIDVYNNSATQAQKDAVATLMFHCGVAVDMNYDVSSGAYSSDVPHALKTYFGYDTGMEYLYRDYTTNDDFVTALKTELTNERPVYYDGQSGYSGHAFVCDGYDADSKFHFNWGWSGSSNGYFELSALNPGSLGIGGGIGGFNYDQGIVIGIQKLQSITGETSFKLVYDGITTEVTSLTSISQQFEVHPGFIRNRGASDFIGNIGLALYTEGNTLVNYRQIAGFSSTNPMKPIYSVLTKPNYTLPSSLSTGTYKLCPVYSTDDDLNTHVLMSVKPGCVPYLTIEVKSNGTVAIGEPSYAAPELSFSNITIGNDSKMYLNKYTEIKARITNTGNADYVKDLRLLFFTDDPGISGQIINQSISIGKGESKEFTFIIPPQLQQANYSFSFEYITKESIEWNSEGYYFTDQTYSRSPGISVTVLPEPAAPVISLVGDLTFLNVNNASRVNKHAPNLKVKVKNTGGLFSNGFEAFFYNPSGPEYSYENQTVVIGEGEEKEIVFNSDINLEPGNYSVDIFYNGSDGWTYLNPPGLPFTLVEPETNNNLVSLTPSAGTLTPAFSAAVQDYTVEVSNATASIDLTVTAVSQYATIIGAGTQPLNVGENIFPIIVTAENGSSKTYTVTVTKSEDTNSVSASWITIIGTGPFVYDGTQHKPGITVSDGETTLTETADYTVTYGANIDAGESSGTITITGAGEYTGSATKTFAIERRALTATAMPDATKLYDRTTTAVVTLTPTNLVTADAGSVTAAATAGFDTKDVGTSIPITITGITLDGGRAFNYIAPDPDTYTGLTAGITPAPYTYAVVASQKILQYSSLTYITAPSFGLGVVLEGNSEQVAGGLTWYTDATYLTAADNTVFNTLAPVTLYWRFTTTDANYEPTVKEGGPVDFEVIEGAPQDILFDMVSPVSKVYGDASFINQAVNSTPEGNAVAYSSSAPAVATVDAVTGEVTILSAGQTNITATAAMVPGKYRSTSATYELIVSPKPITGADVTVDGTYIYNGSPRTPAAAEITVSLSGHTLTAGTDYTIGAGTATAPGIATVTVSGAGNYTGSATGSFTIDKLTLTATATASNKTYDATAAAAVTLTATGVVGGESVVLTAAGTFADVNVGTGIAVAISNVQVSGANAGNYNAPSAADITPPTADITPASYIYVVGDEQNIKAGSSIDVINVAPVSGSGVNNEAVEGNLEWFNESTLTTTASDADFASAGNVRLYWRFTATLANYVTTPHTGSTLFAITDGDDQDVTIEQGSGATVTYGDENLTIVATNASVGGGTISFTSSNTAVATFTTISTYEGGTMAEIAINGVGTAIIKAVAAAVPGTYAATEATYTVTVNPKSISGASVEVDGSFTYSGNIRTPAAADITVSIDGSALASTDYTFATTSGGIEAGAATITVTGTGNYTGSATGIYNIERKALTIDALSSVVAPRAYNGTTAASVTSVAFTGLVGSETLSKGTDYTVDGAEYNSADVADATEVTATVALIGAGSVARNYSLASGELTASAAISKATVATGSNKRVEALENTAAEYVFDLTTLLPAITGSFGEVDFSVNIMTDGDNIISGPLGIYGTELTIPVASALAGRSASINVTITSANYEDFLAVVQVVTSARKQVTIAAVMTGGTYNGAPYAYGGVPVITETSTNQPVDNIDLVIAYEAGGVVSSAAPVNAGDYRLILSVPEGNTQYFGSVTIDFTIAKRATKVVADNKTITIGSPLPAFTYSVSNVVNGETAITGTPTVSSPTADISTAGSYPIVVDMTGVAATANYALAFVPAENGTLTVVASTPSPSYIPVSGISLDATYLELPAGQSRLLNETVYPSGATNTAVGWISSDETVATVTNGRVTGIAIGTATISAITNDGGYTATCTVIVSNATGIESGDGAIRVYIDETTIYVDSPSSEIISVYSFTGQLLFLSAKPEGQATFTPATRIAEKALIIKGSTGWTTKTHK